MRPLIVPAKEAAAMVFDGATVLTTGFSLLGVAEQVYKHIEDRFLESGAPKDLTLVHAAGQSFYGDGIDHLAHEGLLKRIVGSHWGMCPGLGRLIEEEKVEGFCLPMGQLVAMYKAVAARRPGVISEVGLGTFIDPKLDGGRLNQKAVESGEEWIQRVTLGGRECLFYKSLNFDFYIGRGTTADEYGNITMEDEAVKLSALSAAQAAKACGGRVIVQVRRVARSQSLKPKDVVIPGAFVDVVAVAEEPDKYHRQTYSAPMNPAYSGRIRVPKTQTGPAAIDARKLIGYRAVQEVQAGDVVNLGVGIPGDAVGGIMEEKGMTDQVRLTVESGIIGGVPLGGGDFGAAKNAEAIIDDAFQFDYYNGWGVDVTFMGAAEVDKQGNVNVSKFGRRSVGCGGFIDITQPAKKVVFCFTFTAGGLDVTSDHGRLQVLQEGKYRKFVDRVKQVTFSGQYALSRRQPVYYVTERAVFKLSSQGLELTEVAPGIDVERDILPQMNFRPRISPDLKEMSPDLFGPDESRRVSS